MTTTAIIQCAKLKADRPMSAEQLYDQSPIFRWTNDICKARGYHRLILSAKHFILKPDDVVAPYDMHLAAETSYTRFLWKWRVRDHLPDPSNGKCVVFAGRTYLEGIEPFLNEHFKEVIVPMRGLEVGEMRSWLLRGNHSVLP